LRGVGTHLGSLLHTEVSATRTRSPPSQPPSRPAPHPTTNNKATNTATVTHTRRSRERPTLASARAAKESADEEDAVKSSSPFAHEIDSSVEATSGVAGFSLLGT